MTADASTPKAQIRPTNRQRNLSRLLSAMVLVSLTAALAQPARAMPAQCKPDDGLFGNYQPAASAEPVPDIPFLDKDGGELRLSKFRGRAVVLNFWATWCAPCVREMPQLNRLSAFVYDNAIDVLTVSEDRKGLVAAPKFYATHNLNDLPVLADPRGRLMRAFDAPGLPLTVLIDKTGNEVGRVIGPAEWDSVEIVEFVRRCLADNPS